MKKYSSHSKKKSKPSIKRNIAVPDKENTHKSVNIEKVSNGFVVGVTTSNDRSYKEKKYIAKTQKEAKGIVSKVI
jgi:hypothetical protein